LRVAKILAAALSALVILSACGSVQHVVDDSTAALPLSSSYRLAPGDKLKVNIFNEPDLSGEYQVSDDGRIAFPLIGELRAAGSSAEEFRQHLIDALRNGFVRNPRVTVEIANYRPINVVGEVRNAGQFTYRPGISVKDAIAMAGGYTYRANTGTVYVTRSAGGEQISIDLKSKDGATVMPGDNIRVPERYF
jgi:protein involved in polysaccharide export with SLBB domain